MVTNSFILCRDFTDLPYKSLKEFRVALAKELIGSYASRKRPGRPRHTPAACHFCQAHYPIQGAENGRRCHHCYHNKKERHQCGTARIATSSCDIMVVMMTVLESTISNMAHQVKTKHYPTYGQVIPFPFSLSFLTLTCNTHSLSFMYTWQCILTLHANTDKHLLPQITHTGLDK